MERPAKVRISSALQREAKVAAARAGVTLEAWLNRAIEAALAQEKQ